MIIKLYTEREKFRRKKCESRGIVADQNAIDPSIVLYI